MKEWKQKFPLPQKSGAHSMRGLLTTQETVNLTPHTHANTVHTQPGHSQTTHKAFRQCTLFAYSTLYRENLYVCLDKNRFITYRRFIQVYFLWQDVEELTSCSGGNVHGRAVSDLQTCFRSLMTAWFSDSQVNERVSTGFREAHVHSTHTVHTPPGNILDFHSKTCHMSSALSVRTSSAL